MRSITLLLSCFIVSISANAQELKNIAYQYRSLDTTNKVTVSPMSDRAFDKYLTDHFSYTILGSTGPATGLKLETASPSISLRGTLAKSKSNDEILTLELQAGADSKLMQVFSDNKWSSYFKAGFGYNVLFGPITHKNKNVFFNYANYAINNRYLGYNYRYGGIVKYEELVRQGQKTSVMTAMLQENFMDHPSIKALEAILNDPNLTSTGPKLAPKKKLTLLETLANEIMTDYGMKIGSASDVDKNLELFAGYWKDFHSDTEAKQKFNKLYDKQVTIKKNAVDSLYRFEIAQVKNAYTSKFVWWLNTSPFLSNTNFKEYTKKPDTLTDKSSFLFGTKVSLNFFWKYHLPHQFLYVTVGASPQKMNSLDEMTKYTYKKSTAIKLPTTTVQSEALSKEETGTGYEGSFQSGFGMEYFAEAYWVPWTADFVPGLYGKFSFSHSDSRVNKDRTAVYMGIIWNLTNGEKDAKNLLSIVPYAGWSNLNPQQYTDGVKTGNRPLHDLFTAGIQVGIPINIGK